MADLKITVDVTSLVDAKNKLTAFQGQLGKTGSGSVVGLARAIGSVERNIADLAEAQRKNQISSRAFSQGLLEQQKALEALGMSSSVAKKRVEELANSSNKMESFKRAMNGLSVNQLVTGVGAVQSKIKQLVDAQAKGTIGANAYQKGLLELKRAYEQLGYSSQQATAAVRQYAAQLQRDRAAQQAAQAARELAQAQAQAAERTRQLRLRFQEGYAAFDRARKQMRDLREAMRQGIITTEQYKEAVRRLREEQTRAAAATERLGRQSGVLRQRMSRSSVAVQQFGYQIGDLLVQVQSGTNFFVAFGQQATQLAGLLTMSMNPATIKLGAALSIIIPLTTAAAAMFMRTRDSGKEVADVFEEVANSLDRMNSATNSVISPFSDLQEKFGENAEQARQFLSVIRSIEKIRFQDAFAGAANSLQESFNIGEFSSEALATLETAGRAQETALTGLLERQRRLLEQGENVAAIELGTQITNLREQTQKGFGAMARDVDSLADRLGIANTQAIEFSVILAKIQEARTFEERGQAALNLANYIQQNVEITENLSEAEKDAVEQAVQLALQFLEASETAGATAGAAKSTAQFLAEQEELLANQTILYLEIAKYGENSLKVEEERAYQARLAYENELRRKEVDEALILVIMDQYDAMLKAREEAEKTTAAMEELDGLNLSSLTAEVDFLTRRLNISRDAAMALALAMPIGVSEGDVSRGARGLRPGMRSRRVNFDRDLGLGRFADKPEGGSGGVDPLAQLRERLALEKELLGKSEAQQRVIQALGINWRSYGEETVNSLVASIEEMDRFNERVQQQQQLADSIANSFGDAFMSIIDGTKSTKDAFKDMARAIIADLYQMFVVKQITGFIGNAIMGAIGGGGPTRPTMNPRRASGGSMMSGRPYLVGEHGPELVIPGRSSTVTNADLTRKSMGGSDAVVVNQTINVTGGTDPAAIRQEVAKLMPAITNATKTAVIDARRRGGQMKAAFQ
jgi:methyl-accepting chemotaxis protein